ncbi:MAG TPA: hypothetical protein PKY35_03390 [Candidatus Hydrogenedentes bacterium]|nr:hypothetical protein [Candidatus Hydrogenedentota bacterium]HOL76048.1 hypothetical protein [Candidatus Hydrogenedentota bacterium]HPO84662.1 hypothetical protein [Candidatus Hydrogenedentota bacterium]
MQCPEGPSTSFSSGSTETAAHSSALPSISPNSVPGDSAAATYENEAKGIRIFPGLWRPHYPWEHIAWISPSWPSQDYIWLDFPEAIFTDKGLIFLSHINPQVKSEYHDLPSVPWQTQADGICFERELPNGVKFGGSISQKSPNQIELRLTLFNGLKEPLRDITLQTCAFLRAIREFSDFTRDNKLVFIKDTGWTPLSQAMNFQEIDAPYRVGWRIRGRRLADLPIILTLSNQEERFFAFTWGKSTLSMVGNPNHPCVHADPCFPDLEPGQEAQIRGVICFVEGNVEEFNPNDLLGDI